MKKKTINYSIFVLVLSMFIATAVFAECPAGKTEVTIVAGNGEKIIEICVPDQAVDHIGGPGEQVIPAICPCFSQEDVEIEVNANDNIICERHDGYTGRTGDPCKWIECYDQISGDSYFEALEGPLPTETFGICGESGTKPFSKYGTACSTYDTVSYDISEEEADACVAILNTFVP